MNKKGFRTGPRECYQGVPPSEPAHKTDYETMYHQTWPLGFATISGSMLKGPRQLAELELAQGRPRGQGAS